jgi:hypothetical protein
MTPWTDVEINRFLLREGMFKRRGLSASESEQLAEKCLMRDRDLDDRRACIECKNLQRGFICKATGKWSMPMTIFHRCHFFAWQVPRTQGQA